MLKSSLSLFLLLSLISCQNYQEQYEWTGILLGTQSKIIVHHDNLVEAKMIVKKCGKYLRAIERQISLYQQNSAINQLNENKVLYSPSEIFREIINLANKISKQTEGVFDITIAPLLKAIKNKRDIANAHKFVDYKKIKVSKKMISIGSQQEISLNALGQGFLADKAYQFLKTRGIYDALINTGEYRCIGKRVWKISTQYKGQWYHFDLSGDQALAVSHSRNNIDPYAKSFNLDNYLAIVIASSASLADAFATVHASKKLPSEDFYKLIIVE